MMKIKVKSEWVSEWVKNIIWDMSVINGKNEREYFKVPQQ
jgi:hypothetical protein